MTPARSPAGSARPGRSADRSRASADRWRSSSANRPASSGPVRHHKGVMGSQGGELVGGRYERQPRQLGDLLRSGFGEAGRRVQAGADRRSSQGQFVQIGQGGRDALQVGVELGDVTGELLAERQRYGILQVRAADLDEIAELVGTFTARRRATLAPPAATCGPRSRPRRCAWRWERCRWTTAIC